MKTRSEQLQEAVDKLGMLIEELEHDGADTDIVQPINQVWQLLVLKKTREASLGISAFDVLANTLQPVS